LEAYCSLLIAKNRIATLQLIVLLADDDRDLKLVFRKICTNSRVLLWGKPF
jgi:hypothetical protein